MFDMDLDDKTDDGYAIMHNVSTVDADTNEPERHHSLYTLISNTLPPPHRTMQFLTVTPIHVV